MGSERRQLLRAAGPARLACILLFAAVALSAHPKARAADAEATPTVTAAPVVTAAPATTAAPVTTAAPATRAPVATSAPATTSAPSTTSAPTTTNAPGTPPSPAAATAVAATLYVAGPNVWPYSFDKASDLVRGLGNTLTTVSDSSIDITSVVQTTATDARRRSRHLLDTTAPTAVAVALEINAGSTGAVSAVSADLISAAGSAALTKNVNHYASGYSISSTKLLTQPTAQAPDVTFNCANGSVTGQCVSNQTKLRVWVIVVIAVVVGLVGLAIITTIICCCWRRCFPRKQAPVVVADAKPAALPQTPTGAQPFYAGQTGPGQATETGVLTGAMVAPTNRLYKKDEGNPNAINMTAAPGGQAPGAFPEGPVGPQAGAGAAAEQSTRRKGRQSNLPMPVDFAPTGKY